MTIAEKLVKIAENEQKVFDAGYEKGKSEGGVIDESKIIEVSATDKDILKLNDVSEIPHDIELQVSGENMDLSTIKIRTSGKNLFNIDAPFDITPESDKPYSGWLINPTGEYVTITIIDKNPDIDVGELYLGLTANGNAAPVANWNISNGAVSKLTTTETKDNKYLSVYKWKTAGIEAIKERFDIQVEYGTTSTEYEPYIGSEYSVEADGTIRGVKSISPNMTFMPNKLGLQITANYHKSWGMQAEQDRFWDTYQECGARTNYDYAFYQWKSDCFNPKYLNNIDKAQNMFYNANMRGNEHIKRLNFSGCRNFIQTFQGCEVEELGIIDASNTNSGYGFTGIFSNATLLRKIEKFIFPTDSKVAYNYPFNQCNSLTDITIGGTIYKTITFEWCPLSKESIKSIIEHLSDTVSDQTLTLKSTAVNTAFETEEGLADGSTSTEWATLIATKSNWTISLV